MSEINLGDEVVDIITGFEGVATHRLENLFGGTEYKVQQRNLNDDRRPMESIWVEAGRLEVKKIKGKSIYFEDEGCSITPEEHETGKAQG